MKLRILDRFLGAQLLWPFLFGVAAFSSLFFATSDLLKLTNLVFQGMPIQTALELVFLTLPGVIVFTLPMAALLSVLVVFSKLSSDSEIVACFASGISLYRIMIPVFALGIAVTAITFGMSEFVVPASSRLSQELKAKVLKQELSTKSQFVVIDKATNSTVYVRGGFDAKSRTMKDVTITRFSESIPSQIFQASTVSWSGTGGALDLKNASNTWMLSDGRVYVLRPDGSTVSMTFSGLKKMPVELEQTPEDIARHMREPQDMSYRELRQYVRDMSGTGVEKAKLLELQVALYNKLAIPFAALVFAMIGAPLSVRPSRRSGASVGLGLSLLIIFAYWFVWHFTTALAGQGSVPPAIGAFTADVLGVILGILLLFRTAK